MTGGVPLPAVVFVWLLRDMLKDEEQVHKITFPAALADRRYRIVPLRRKEIQIHGDPVTEMQPGGRTAGEIKGLNRPRTP